MLKLYLSGILLFIVITLTAQDRERVVSGQLKSKEDGSPLPGINIVIKGTERGTTTDEEGRYSISVPIGSTLVFSFVGMQTREVLVTENNLQSTRGEVPLRFKSKRGSWDPSILQDTTTREVEGITTLTSHTATYNLRTNALVPSEIVSVRRSIWALTRKRFVVNTNSDQYMPTGVKFQFNSLIAFSSPTRLPELQSSYAQGRNNNGTIVWQGPDQQETLGWGPQVKTLEYTGNPYPYDINGTITTAGNGNGKPVNTYNPYKFLRTGITTSNELVTWFPGLGRATTNLEASRKKQLGIIPNNESTIDNVSMIMKGIKVFSKLKADVNVLYNTADGTLMNRGSNISNIMGSMMLTAPTFDAANGYSRKAAVDNPSVFQLSNGSVRSSAPGLIDNPYGLIVTLPDNEKSQRLFSSLGLNYDADRLKFSLGGSAEQQLSDIVFGVQPGYSSYIAGRRTQRHELRNDLGINFLSSYWNRWNDHTLTFSLGYQLKQEQRNVLRTDGFGYTNENFHSINSADSSSTYGFALTRNIHEIMTKVKWEYERWDVQLSNRNYFSNTLKQNYVNLFPSLIAKVDLRYNSYYLDFFQELKPFASISRTIRESPAIFGNQAFLSTRLDAQQYNQYFENREIVWNRQLRPETELKSEVGFRSATHFGLSLDFSYYSNTTYDLIMPVWDGDQPLLKNAATVNNRGANVAITYSSPYYSDAFYWGISMRWTKYNSVVTSVDLPGDYLPVAGFSNMQTVVSKGQQLGAIYGTTWLRDNRGNQIIGSDGFPLVDTNLKKIGSPIPLYLLSLEPYVDLNRRLKLSFIFDFKKGGQVWNGTKAALNYYGRSQESADMRNASQYTGDLLHYGPASVGEEHIEDASWIRLNEVSLSYKTYPVLNGAKKELGFSFVAKNLLLVTRYSGVDPGTSLYGYSNGTGLDLFNAPSLKSYSFLVTFKL
jgi:hypothetical protein